MKKLFVLVCLLAIGFCNVAWAAKRQAKHVVLLRWTAGVRIVCPRQTYPTLKA